MKAFTVRHIPTGHLMLALKGCGHSLISTEHWWKPGTKYQRRLFPTKRGAQNAMTAYCRGEFETVTTRCGEYGEEIDQYTDVKPNTSRPRSEYEVVEVTLTIVEPTK